MSKDEQKKFIEAIEFYNPESKDMTAKNFYEVLGLKLYSDYSEIKHAERRDFLTKEYESKKELLDLGKKCISMAQLTLRDKNKKGEYDKRLKIKYRDYVKDLAVGFADKQRNTLSIDNYKELVARWKEYQLNGSIADVIHTEWGLAIEISPPTPAPTPPSPIPLQQLNSSQRPIPVPRPTPISRQPINPENSQRIRSKQATVLFVALATLWLFFCAYFCLTQTFDELIAPAYRLPVFILFAFCLFFFYFTDLGRFTLVLFLILLLFVVIGGWPEIVVAKLLMVSLLVLGVAYFIFSSPQSKQFLVYVIPTIAILVYIVSTEYQGKDQNVTIEIEPINKVGYIVAKTGASIRKGPTEKDSIMTFFSYGSMITVLGREKKSKWYKVYFKTASKKELEGFVPEGLLGFTPIKVKQTRHIKHRTKKPVLADTIKQIEEPKLEPAKPDSMVSQ